MDQPVFSIQPGSELEKKIKFVPSSTIPLDKPTEPIMKRIDLYTVNSEVWRQKSEELLADYKFGWNFGKYGDITKVTTEMFFKRLAEVIVTMVTHECSKNDTSSESFESHFNVIKSIMDLIAKDLVSFKLKKHKVEALSAMLHGFVDSRISTDLEETKGKDEQRRINTI